MLLRRRQTINVRAHPNNKIKTMLLIRVIILNIESLNKQSNSRNRNLAYREPNSCTSFSRLMYCRPFPSRSTERVKQVFKSKKCAGVLGKQFLLRNMVITERE